MRLQRMTWRRGGRRRSTRVVAVTGAAGRVGQACLRALNMRDDDVIAVDLHRGSGTADWRIADLTDPAAAANAIKGATHLIHLAGATAPDPAHANEVLLGNISIAANVFAAFVAGRGTTAVTASSTSAYGGVWSREERSPEYLPVDEEHPCLPEDTYGLSKVVIEQLGAMWSRSAGITSVMLRFPWTSADHETDRLRSFITVLAADPDIELGRRQLWAYVHVDDLADAFMRALDLADGRAHVLNVASPHVPGDHRLSALALRCHPSTQLRADLDACGSFSTERARQVLAWVPTRTFTP